MTNAAPHAEYKARLGPEEDPADYEEIRVDGRVFYRTRKNEQPTNSQTTQPVPRRRYSEQLNDPHIKAQNDFRRVSFLTRFASSAELEQLTEAYRGAITEAASILRTEWDIPPATIYRHFALQNYGFDPEDFGCAEDGPCDGAREQPLD